MNLRAPVLLIACSGLFAQDAPLQRDGVWWVQVIKGTLPAAGTLRVHMRGPVTVRGESGTSEAEYTLRKRVRASTEAEARRLLAQLSLRSSRAAGAGVLSLVYPHRPRALAEMQVRAPRQVSLLSVETHSGDVEIYDIAGQVQTKTGGGVIRMDRIGRDAIARTAGGDIRLGVIGGSVRCFSGGGTIQVEQTGGESWFDTAGGDINIGECGGAVHASTAGGNIHVGRSGGAVLARTAGGRIDVQHSAGIVVAGNSGGSIHVGTARGVRVEATGGSIRLRGSSGELRAVSDVGSILAELIPGARIQDSVLSTGAGDITVYIPSNIPLTIQALNETSRPGRIISEFPEIPVRRTPEESRPATLAEGALNGGGPVLRLTSTGGVIYLRRVGRDGKAEK